MPLLRVLLAFAKDTDGDLVAAAGGVMENMTDNPSFPNPPVTMAALATARDELRQALVAQSEGGKLATATKKNKRAALISLLRQLATYVQTTSDNHLEKLLSSGFQAASFNSAQSPLENPGVPRLINGVSGQLIIRMKPVPNARCYEARIAPIAADGTLGPWQSGIFLTSTRYMALNDLKPGCRYQVQIRAIGGSTGTSGWSDATSHMSL
jgi:hypothetical protein